MADCREAESLALLIWGKIVYEQARGAHMVMGQQYSLGRRGLSRLARTRPYIAEAGTRDIKFENEILVLRPPSWNLIHPPHGTPCRPSCCHKRLPFSVEISTFYDGPSTELQPPALQRSSRLMNHSVGQSINHSHLFRQSPACLVGLCWLSVSSFPPGRNST